MAGRRFVYVCSVLLLLFQLLLILYSSVTQSSKSTPSSIQTCFVSCVQQFLSRLQLPAPPEGSQFQMCTVFFHGTVDTYWPGLLTWASTISAMSWGQRNIRSWSECFFFKSALKISVDVASDRNTPTQTGPHFHTARSHPSRVTSRQTHPHRAPMDGGNHGLHLK